MSLQNLPKLILVAALVAITSFLYLRNAYEHLRPRLQVPQTISDGVFTLLENLNGKMLRRIVIGVVYVVPVVVEMMVLVFLSRLVGETCGGWWWVKILYCCVAVGIEGLILIPFHFNMVMANKEGAGEDENRGVDGDRKSKNFASQWGNGMYKIGRMILLKKPDTTLFDCRVHAWIFLYAMALLTTTLMVKEDQVYKPILLAGPFLLASGALLVLSATEGEEGENLVMNLVRRVLRKTLGGILKELGEDVTEDEMLQLLMLRWIVDYWASPTSSETANGAGDPSSRASSQSNSSASRTDGRSDSVHNAPTTAQNASRFNTATTSQVRRSQPRPLGWEELSSMLSLTADQMYQEVDSHSRNEGGRNQRDQTHKNQSMRSLQAMLLSFNGDERARPAVMSYKLAIEDIPPSRDIAICIAFFRRCPAFLSVIYLYLFDPVHATPCATMLLPVILLEAMKLSEWMTACHRFEKSKTLSIDAPVLEEDGRNGYWFTNLLPDSMSPIEILLSEDYYSPYYRGTALRVWENIQTSVPALELGLTAMKCARTAQVATDLTFDVISLANFAAEIKNEGLGGGIKLLVLDLFHFHLEKTSPSTQQDYRSNQRSKYSHAALNLVENGQILRRNVHEILDDGRKHSNFLSPITSFYRGIFGENEEESAPVTNNADEAKAEDAVQSEGNHGSEGEDTLKNEVGQDSPPSERSQRTKMHVQSSSVPQDLELDDEPDGHDQDNDSWTAINAQLSRDASVDYRNISEADEANAKNKPAIPTPATRHAVIEEPQNHLKWIGASVAILGTVIGGIALTNNKNDSSHQDGNEESRGKSTVTIERLEDEEE